MTFESALDFILRPDIEGGYVNDPNDPGGETNMGITKRTYPDEDIKNLTKERASFLYRRDFWDKCRCGELPPGVDLLVFDISVNQGTDIAIRLLQLAINVTVDGIIGPMTLMTANHQQSNLRLELNTRRLVRYGNTKNFNIYGLGWIRRAMKCYEAAGM